MIHRAAATETYCELGPRAVLGQCGIAKCINGGMELG
jgi:hypothetical protein